MDLFSIFVVFLVIVALAFFAFGVLAGYHAGHRDGRREAVDELYPSYSTLMVELAKVPNKYKDLNRSDNPLDDTWTDYPSANVSKS